MKVRINCDEWYPVLTLDESGHWEIEATPEQVERWKKTTKEFLDMQTEIDALPNEPVKSSHA